MGDEFGNLFQLKVEADCPFLAASAFRKTVQDFRSANPECDPSVSRVKSEDPFGCQLCEFPELMSCEGVEQNLNTDVCSFGSHNYVTDSSHSDDLHQLNGLS